MTRTDLHPRSTDPNTSPPPSESAPSALGFTPDEFIEDDAWAKPRPKGNRRLVVSATVLSALLLSLGAFSLGAKLGKSNATTSNPLAALRSRFGGGGGGGAFGGAGGGNGGGGTNTNSALGALLGDTSGSGAAAPVEGTVTKVEGRVITITQADGSTVTVTVANTAAIGRRTTKSFADIKAGDAISVVGDTDSAGNVAANSVTLGDLEATTTDASTASTTPPPSTGANLGGLLGG